MVPCAILPGCNQIACSVAAEQGNLQLLKQLLALQPVWDWVEDISFQAAAHGHLEMLQWLVRQGCPINILRCILRAATGGHLAVLQWLRQLFPSYFKPYQAMQLAASAGDLRAIQSLRRMDPPCAWDVATSRAAAGEGHLHILVWMRQQSPPCPWDASIADEAALRGQLQVLQWLQEQQPLSRAALGGSISGMAAQGGHINTLAWLRSLQPDAVWDATVWRSAAASGQVRVLEWLRDQDIEGSACSSWDESTCHAAAAAGNLETLQWLRDPSHIQPCPWDRGTAISAAISGHLPILQWMHEVAPVGLVDVGAAIAACAYQQPHIFEWLLQERVLTDASLQTLCNLPAHRRFVLQSLHTHGLSSRQRPDSLFVPASMGDVVMVQLLLPELSARDLVLDALLAVVARGSVNTGKLSVPIEAAAEYWGNQAAVCDYLQTARLLLEQLHHLTSFKQDELANAAVMAESIIPVQLSFMGVQPRISWGSETHSLAAARGSLPLLKWLLAQPDRPGPLEVHPGCTNARMLLLVHGHGWSVPDAMQECLLAAEQRHSVFYQTAQHHDQKGQLAHEPGTSLGDLPQSIIQKIACMADIDFSWTHAM